MPDRANMPAGTISRTSAGLREMLFQQMEDIKSGKTNPHAGMAVAKLAAQIIASVRLAMEQSTEAGRDVIDQSVRTLDELSHEANSGYQL